MAIKKKEKKQGDVCRRLGAHSKEEEMAVGKLTLGEIIHLADQLKVRASEVAIAEAMGAHHLTYEEVLPGGSRLL